MLLRPAHLAATNAFAFLRLPPMSDRDNDIEILALRHQPLVLQRRVGRPAFADIDRAILAGLLHHLPSDRLRQLLLLRLARENTSWGYRRIHGELAALGIKVAASTVSEILKEHGIPPAPERQNTTRADFLRSQTDAPLACDLFETRTPTGARLHVFAPITDPQQIARLNTRKHHRLGGILHEYQHATRPARMRFSGKDRVGSRRRTSACG